MSFLEPPSNYYDSLWRKLPWKIIIQAVLRTSLVVQWLRTYLSMGEHWFDLWSEKIPHAAAQLSLLATTIEPACRN